MTEHSIAIIVVAAGSSTRFGKDKLSVQISGHSVLERAVASVRAAFPDAPAVLVVRADQVDAAQNHWQPLGVRVVAGGAHRQDSVKRGFAALEPADDTVILIHDAARPFVPVADVLRVAAAAAESGAALLAAPLVDTVKRLRSDGSVETTVPRERLARALTPQAFRAGVLRRAWEAVGEGIWSDEAALVERLGGTVMAVTGDPRNVKVTHPEDLETVSGVFPSRVRVGQGVDVHPFAPGRPLWLCGVELPGETGLAGHSDADVALHAGPTRSSARAARATSASTSPRATSAGATPPRRSSSGAPSGWQRSVGGEWRAATSPWSPRRPGSLLTARPCAHGWRSCSASRWSRSASRRRPARAWASSDGARALWRSRS